jgi:hypothetical protein
MIEFTKSYKTSDGQVFGTIEEAQKHELSVLFLPHPILQATGLPSEPMNDWIAEMVLDNKETIIDILTTKSNSKPKARKANGGSKKRTTKSIGNPDGLL